MIKRKLLGSIAVVTLGSVIASMNACTEFQPASLSSYAPGTDIISASGFEKTQQVLQQACISCHNPAGGASDFRFSTAQQYISSGLIVPGKPRQSKLIYRMINFNDPSVTTDNMPLGGSAVGNADYQAIYNWIANMPSDSSPFECNDDTFRPANISATSTKRLSIRQYTNTLRELVNLGLNNASTTNTLINTALNQNELPADTGTHFSRENNTFGGIHAQSYFNIANYLATQISSNATYRNSFITNFINLNRGNCTTVDTSNLSTVCRDQLIHNFASRAFRRPLRTPAMNVTLTNNTAVNEPAQYIADFTGVTTQQAIDKMIFRVLLAPHFLFQIEDQNSLQSQNLGSNTFYLSPHAYISRLSYRFWNTMPDTTLWQMATTENFNDNSGYANVLNYVIGNKAKLDDAMREYMHDWLKLSRTPRFNVNNRFELMTPTIPNSSYNDNLRNEMMNEVQEFGSYVTTSGGTYADLFLSNVSLARNQTLMSLYGQGSPAPAYANLNETNAVRFPANTRVGLLTRAAMLISGSELANPILRGAHLRKDILCLTLGAPPSSAIDTFNGISVPHNISTREKVNIKTSGNDCVGCHNLLNPLGFAFSNFDSLGRFITQEPIFSNSTNAIEGYVPVDSAVNLSALFGPNSSAANAREFSNFIANQESAKVCFAEKLMTFSMGRNVSRTADACRLDKIYSNLNDSDPLIDAIRATALDMEFRVRKVQ